ncbi:unnamed protein product [Closterium sp. Yama58-4]|nr:unnamed protein product [Closterium sp. Yama58-4]
MWAAWAAGGVAVPLCESYPPEELLYVLRDSGASLVVGPESSRPVLAPLAAEVVAAFVPSDPLEGRELEERDVGEERAGIEAMKNVPFSHAETVLAPLAAEVVAAFVPSDPLEGRELEERDAGEERAGIEAMKNVPFSHAETVLAPLAAEVAVAFVPSDPLEGRELEERDAGEERAGIEAMKNVPFSHAETVLAPLAAEVAAAFVPSDPLEGRELEETDAGEERAGIEAMKNVPFSHAGVFWPASPQAHVHGIMNALLSPLSAGATVSVSVLYRTAPHRTALLCTHVCVCMLLVLLWCVLAGVTPSTHAWHHVSISAHVSCHPEHGIMKVLLSLLSAVATSPRAHVHGIVNALLSPLSAGATVEFFPSHRFSATAVWQRWRERGAHVSPHHRSPPPCTHLHAPCSLLPQVESSSSPATSSVQQRSGSGGEGEGCMCHCITAHHRFTPLALYSLRSSSSPAIASVQQRSGTGGGKATPTGTVLSPTRLHSSLECQPTTCSHAPHRSSFSQAIASAQQQCGSAVGERGACVIASPLSTASHPCSLFSQVEFLPSHRFSAAAVWQRWRESYPDGHYAQPDSITFFTGVPTHYMRLLQEFDRMPLQLQRKSALAASKLRLMMSGSAACPDELMRRWHQVTGQRLLERYGMTEFAMALTNPLLGEKKSGSVGVPLRGVKVKLADTAKDRHSTANASKTSTNSSSGNSSSTGSARALLGHLSAPGAFSSSSSSSSSADSSSGTWGGGWGELLVKSHGMFLRYWNRPQETAEAFDSQGWFRTGDIASVDSHGYWQIHGRASVDIIKTRGFKVSALEIESKLLEGQQQGVTRGGVSGTSEAALGEHTAITLDELRKWAAPRMAHYKVPSRLRVVATMPRNAMGKVNKKDILKSLFAPMQQS